MAAVGVGFDAGRGEAPPASWTRYTVGRGRVEVGADGVRLVTEDAVEGVLADAQIDDYHGRRSELPWQAPVRLAVRARWSCARAELRGTSGFGFWNDPIDAGGRFVAAPRCLWFFQASAPSKLRVRDGGRREGFVAGVMRGGSERRSVLWAGNLALRVPGVGRVAARAGERRVGGGDVPLPDDFDLSRWHDYDLEWTEEGARFAVDGAAVATFGREEVPAGPLGFVAWIDTNWSALEVDGRYRAGRLAAPGRQWLELGRVVVEGGQRAGAS